MCFVDATMWFHLSKLSLTVPDTCHTT